MSAAQDVGTAVDVAVSKQRSPSPHPIDPGQCRADTHTSSAGVEHLSSAAEDVATTMDRAPHSTPDAVQAKVPAITRDDPPDGYLHLRLWAEVFEDYQQARLAVESRIRSATRDGDLMAGSLHGLKESEHQAGLILRRVFRRVVSPGIRDWQKESVGIGEHTLARLLGVIGHPVHTTVHRWEGGELVVKGTIERRVSDLWSYCGHGDPMRRPRKGMTQEEAFACGVPRAKSLVHQMAQYCKTKNGVPDSLGRNRPRSPYRDVYELARIKYQAREGWTLGHQENAAVRLVGKEILRDLWTAAHG